MKRVSTKITFCVLSFFVLTGLNNDLASQITWSGRQHTEYAVDKKHDKRFFENWTDAVIQYDRWRLGMRYEIHTPPQSFSQQKEGQGIYQRFLEYRHEGLTITAGNYYAMLGRGLTLRSYENRMLRWDNNLDGLKIEYRHRYLDILLLGGKMRDLPGQRYESLQGADIRLKPWSRWHTGGTIMTTQLPGQGELTAISGYTQMNFLHWKLYAEMALLHHPDDPNAFRFQSRRAFYASANLLYGPFSLSAEYKDYLKYNLQQGAILNNPPPVGREHLFTLLNRHQLVQNPDDERGYQIEASYAITDASLLTLNTSHTWNHNGRDLYREYYGQYEWDYPENWKWIWGAGRQQDLEARYLNAVISLSWLFYPTQSLKFIGEHQHARIHLTGRQFYTQAATFSWSKAGRLTVSVVAERTTEQFLSRQYWFGFQSDIRLSEKYDLTVFLGHRREGKYCTGGVCVQKPEFRGIELTWLARL